MTTREEELFDLVLDEDLESIEDLLKKLDEEGAKFEYSEENSMLPGALLLISGFNMDLFKRIVTDYCNMEDLERAGAITGIANQHRNDAVRFLVDSGYDITIRSNGTKDVVEAISEQASEADREILAYVAGTGKIKGLDGAIAKFTEFAISRDLIGLKELHAYKEERTAEAEARGWDRGRPFHPETGIPISFFLCFENAEKMERILAEYDVDEAEKERVRTDLEETYHTFSRARDTSEAAAAEESRHESTTVSGGGAGAEAVASSVMSGSVIDDRTSKDTDSPESRIDSRISGPLSPSGLETRIVSSRMSGNREGFGRDSISSRDSAAAVGVGDRVEMLDGALGPDPSEETEIIGRSISAQETIIAENTGDPRVLPPILEGESGVERGSETTTGAGARTGRTRTNSHDGEETPGITPLEARAVPNPRGVGDAAAERTFGQKFCSLISGHGWR